MNHQKDDAVPTTEYPYYWSKQSELPLQDFLKKYKPSMVANDGTKPWLWVSKEPSASADEAAEAAAFAEAEPLLKKLTEEIENIKNDDSIPMRSNKKTGAKSKKEVREQKQSEFAQTLKDIAIKHKDVSGKWLLMVPADRVDATWATLAESLINGPLSETSAYLAKVSTSPQTETPNYQHVICLYIPDVYDKKDVTDIMKILLRKHGFNLSGVKSNLYTYLGIDSKHPSGLQSTIWKNTALLPEAEIKSLKDAYFAELAEAQKAPPAAAEKKADSEPSKEKSTKPKLVKKRKKDDPFGSDDEEDGSKVKKSKA